jgi:NAD(P)H dehydrogenase (quinone)
MNTPTLLVTGATGKIGSAVTEQLLAHRDVKVRALVRRKDARSERLHRLGAEVVIADMFDPQQVESSVRGVDRIAYIPPWHPHVLNSGVLFATAAPRAGVEAIVGLTQWLASPAHPAISTRQMWLLDRLFDRVPGVAHVTVNPGLFAFDYLLPLPLATLFGIFPWPMGGGRNAPASNEDIARVMVAGLLDPARHAGRTYHPTGPEMLSGDDMARILGEVAGRRVRHLDIPIPQMMKALRADGPRLGLDDFLQAQLRWFLEETRLGTWEVGGVTSHVRDLAGIEPESFETVVRRTLERRSDARRTLGNFAREAWTGLRTVITPAIDVAQFERLQQHPGPPHPQLSGESARWAEEHGVRLASTEPAVRSIPARMAS